MKIISIGPAVASVTIGIVAALIISNMTHGGTTALPIIKFNLVIIPSAEDQGKNLSQEINYYYGLAAEATVKKVEYKAAEAKKKFKRKRETTASWQLDMEADAYPDLSQEHYGIIDGIIDLAKQEIDQDAEKRTEIGRAIFALKTIHNLIKPYIAKTNSKSGGFLLSKALSEKNLDCDLSTAIYLSVGEALGLPIEAVYVPNTKYKKSAHTFARWILENGDYFNWEATGGKIMEDREYKEWLCPNMEMILVQQDPAAFRKEWKGQLKLAYREKMYKSDRATGEDLLKTGVPF